MGCSASSSAKDVEVRADLSGLEKLKVKGLPKAMKPWEERGRKAFALPTEG